MPQFQYDDGAMPQAGGPTTRANWSPYVRRPPPLPPRAFSPLRSRPSRVVAPPALPSLEI